MRYMVAEAWYSYHRLSFLLDRETRMPYLEDDKVWYAKTDAEADAKRLALANGLPGLPSWRPATGPEARKLNGKRAVKPTAFRFATPPD